MTNRASIFAFLAATTLAAFATGCMPSEEDIATGAAASAIKSSRNAGETQRWVQAVKPNVCADPATVAAGFAAEPNVGLYPADCATKVADGAVVHMTYHDCTGAFGETHLNGSLDTTFTAGDACDDVKASVKDDGDLTGNGRPIEYGASADVKIKGDERDVAYKSEWAADTWAGRAKGQDDLAVVQDVSTFCLNVGGTSHATVAGYTFDSQLEGIEVCPDACPKAGSLAIHAANGVGGNAQITITFDGTDTAHAVGSSGKKFDIHLVCSGE